MARRLRSIAALATLVAVTLGVPALLVAVAGWPLPGKWPDWDRVRIALQQGDIPAEVVVNTIAVLVWIAWAQLMWALVWEVAVNVRATERGARSRPTPLAPRAMSSAVTRLVALAFSIGVSTLSTASTALATTALPPAAAAPLRPVVVPTVSEPASGQIESTAAGLPRWCVARGDSLWSIAETALGDGSRVNELLELNRSIQSPREIHAGQVLTLPADAQVPADRVPEPETPTVAEPATALYAPEEEIDVSPGDNLWDLADARLERVTGASPSGPEVFDYVNAIVAANQAAIVDPNLIQPGQHLVLPEIGTPPPAPPAGEATSPPAAPPVTTPPVPSTPTPPTTVAPTVAPTQPAPAPTTPPDEPTPTTQATPAPPRNAASATAGSDAAESDTNPVPIVVGVSGATILATGLLAAYRRLRRRQAAAGARAALRRSIPQDVASIERTLVAAADVPLVHWAADELHRLMRNLAVASDVEGTPIIVEISRTDGIEILWSAANPTAPDPWEATADGWTWHRVYDPERPVPPELPIAQLPGLVTIGHRDGRQLMLDLEALGSVAITGDRDRASDLARAITLELTADDALTNAWVDVVGVDPPAADHLGRLRIRDLASATSLVRSVATEFESLLSDTNLPDTFRLRAIDGPEGRELTVLIADPGTPNAELADALRVIGPHRGAAVVVVGDHPGARATIEVKADGSALLLPLRLEFEAAGLPRAAAELVDAAIDDAAHPTETDDEMEPLAPAATMTLFDEPEPNSNGDGAVDDDWQPPSPLVLVHVLGPPYLAGAGPLSPTDVSLVAFLACHGRQATEDQLINAVWNGNAVNRATLWNHITKVRSALGIHMPPRKPGDAVRLGDDVMTDLAVLKACAAHARQAASSRAIELLTYALELIEGPPFDAPGYEWAYEHQYHPEASAAIEDAAIHLVDLALQAGQLDTARRAIEQGLRALPANEPLYRERMKLEAHAGNHTAVRQAFADLTYQLDELGGGAEAFEPSSETLVLARRLTGGKTSPA